MLHWAIICLFYFCMFLLIPGFVCLLHSRGKISFEGKRGKLLFFFLYSLFSWCFVNALIWGFVLSDLHPDRRSGSGFRPARRLAVSLDHFAARIPAVRHLPDDPRIHEPLNETG